MLGEIERTHNHEEQQPVTDHANHYTSPPFIHYEITSPSVGGPSVQARKASVRPSKTAAWLDGTETTLDALQQLGAICATE